MDANTQEFIQREVERRVREALSQSTEQPTPRAANDKPLRRLEAAKWAKVHPNTITNWINMGLKRYRPPGTNSMFIYLSDLEAFIKTQITVQPGTGHRRFARRVRPSQKQTAQA